MEVRAVNKRGLARAGLTEQEQSEVFSAFKHIWRNDGPILERAKELAAKGDLALPVQEMVDALIRSNEQRFGRHLELFRD
jgi:acyl-[acyl carrier protein]--UDP-N-acetylglucosamine O-acyltransferase